MFIQCIFAESLYFQLRTAECGLSGIGAFLGSLLVVIQRVLGVLELVQTKIGEELLSTNAIAKKGIAYG